MSIPLKQQSGWHLYFEAERERERERAKELISRRKLPRGI